MRPLPGDDAFAGRSRSTSLDNDATPLATRNQAPQMTYFMADEKTMEASQSIAPTVLPKQRDISKSSTYGVESLETTIASLAQDSDDSDERLRIARHNWKKNLGQLISRKSEEDFAGSGSPSLRSISDNSRNASPSHQRRSSQATISRPFTPLSFPGGPTSIMSSPRSRRFSEAGSDMDEVASQAIVSSEDEDRDIGSELVDSGSAPQLVMPSIKMPSRRPFTENGKNMGRLKVMVAGDSGVGKTSLIKAIVQICEDIVHVDPISSNPVSTLQPRRQNSKTKSRSGSTDPQSTAQITEIYASTKAYPSWWSDLEESRILRRRKSMGDSVLERNLCFVDTPGYGNTTSCLECITPVVDYIESHFRKVTTFDGLTESDMVNMLSGNGGPQVDLVFYVIMNNIKPVDIEYLKRLSNLTNVIPLIARADAHSVEQISSLKDHILSELNANDIRPFLFGIPSQTQVSSHPSAPYAVSTSPSKDDDNMDASLLMSPDYVQPLAQSELQPLVRQIFERDAIAWLRHSASKKFLAWRSSSAQVSRPQSLYRPLYLPSSSVSQVLTAPVGARTSYALARVTDHAQREERIAQVRLANWAADLQRALQKERLEYEAKARGERALWLTERLGECVQDGTLVPISEAKKGNPAFDQGSGALVKQGTYSRRRETHQDMQDMLDCRDPLGLLKMNEHFKRRGWAVVKALSLLGLVGGIAGFASWFSRQWQAASVADGTFYGLGLSDWFEFGRIDWRA